MPFFSLDLVSAPAHRPHPADVATEIEHWSLAEITEVLKA